MNSSEYTSSGSSQSLFTFSICIVCFGINIYIKILIETLVNGICLKHMSIPLLVPYIWLPSRDINHPVSF